MKSVLTPWALSLNARLIAQGGGLTISRAAGLDEQGGEKILFSAYETPVRSGAKFTLPLYYLNSSVEEAFSISRIEIYAVDGMEEGLYAYVDLDAPQAGDAVFDITSIKWLSKPEADIIYAPMEHGHAAREIAEDTGESVEQSQRRQDALLDQIMAYLGSASVLWAFPGDWIVERGVVTGNAISTSQQT
jgi:hypothetical protein